MGADVGLVVGQGSRVADEVFWDLVLAFTLLVAYFFCVYPHVSEHVWHGGETWLFFDWGLDRRNRGGLLGELLVPTVSLNDLIIATLYLQWLVDYRRLLPLLWVVFSHLLISLFLFSLFSCSCLLYIHWLQVGALSFTEIVCLECFQRKTKVRVGQGDLVLVILVHAFELLIGKLPVCFLILFQLIYWL